MALNPPISLEGTPFRLENENILLKRKGMHIEIKSDKLKSKISTKGKVFLTTARMIFVSSKFKSDKFKSIDMPLANLRKKDFKQPIFGSNYLKFDCLPLYNLLPGRCHIKLWFTEGGCDKFLKIFSYVDKQIGEEIKSGRMSNNLGTNYNTGQFSQQFGYQDPSDPTVIITQQPQVFNPNMNSDQFLGNNFFKVAGSKGANKRGPTPDIRWTTTTTRIKSRKTRIQEAVIIRSHLRKINKFIQLLRGITRTMETRSSTIRCQ